MIGLSLQFPMTEESFWECVHDLEVDVSDC